MGKRITRAAFLIMLLLTILALVGCAPRWEIALSVDGQPQTPIMGAEVAEWAELFPGEVDEDGALSLERALWEYGVDCVERLEVDGRSVPWSEGYDQCWLLPDGRLRLGDEMLSPMALNVVRPIEMVRGGWACQ